MKCMERFSFLSYRRRHRIKYFIIIPLRLIVVVSALVLMLYGVDYLRSKQYADELRIVYYEESLPQPTLVTSRSDENEMVDTVTLNVPVDVVPATTDPQSISIPKAIESFISTYPHNPYRIMDPSLQKLRHQNKDIIGWLTIDGMLDEAVVQRNNTYYLRRDYKGYHNANGALFLDEGCSLTNQPPLYIIYGHNMKSGLMFGCLRNWETQSFYHDNPFIKFKSLYEDGIYVIFAVGTVENEVLNKALYAYDYKTEIMKQLTKSEFIEKVVSNSIYTNVLNILPSDQLLVLVTCIDDDDERRVIVARKLRDDESQDEVMRIAKRNRKK